MHYQDSAIFYKTALINYIQHLDKKINGITETRDSVLCSWSMGNPNLTPSHDCMPVKKYKCDLGAHFCSKRPFFMKSGKFLQLNSCSATITNNDVSLSEQSRTCGARDKNCECGLRRRVKIEKIVS